MIDLPVLKRHSRGIELLRGIFCLWVLFAHLIPWTQFVQGNFTIPSFISRSLTYLVTLFQSNGETHPAVIGFIVLSGYCIHRSGLRRDKLDIRTYCLRRIFRIYPVYFLATAFGCICYFYSASIDLKVTQNISGTETISPLNVFIKIAGLSALIPNLHQSTFLGNAPLHTVMVEIWLYMVYPLFMLLMMKRNSERSLWLIILTVWIAGVVGLTMFPRFHSWWHNGSLFGFLILWWIGAKCVDAKFSSKIFAFKYVFFFAWIILSALLFYEISHCVFVVELRKVVFAACCGMFIFKIDNLNDHFIRFISWIGKPSYSIYALHAPFVHLLLIGGFSWITTAVFSVLIGFISYRFYELPLTQLAYKFSPSKVVA